MKVHGDFVRIPFLLLGLSFISTASWGDIDAEVGLEARYFFKEGLFEQNKLHTSLSTEVTYQNDWGDNSVEVIGFGRYDQQDAERSHADIREASLTHVGNSWELKVGISKVFWGVTESRHLVDIINQTDAVENLDGEDKLGQPMTKLSFEQNWGTIDLFWLPYFRERTFAGKDGRLSAPLAVDTDDAKYESGAEEWRSDFALRFSHYIGDFDFAISHFSGTSRDPELVSDNPFNPKFLPAYYTIDQTGLELQYIFDEWLFKFEGITNSGFDKRFSAAVFGFEYTQVGIFDSNADLGWLVEYLYDDRKETAPHSFEQDIFAGWRYAFNDADSSEILAGIIYDPETEEAIYSVEASKRLASDLKLNIEVRVFEGENAPDAQTQSIITALNDDQRKTASFQNEDYIQLELVKYF
jgi:hypothetical protein